MESYKLAARQYALISPRPALSGEQFPARKIRHWLENDVCIAIERLSKRPQFQKYAVWCLKALSPEAETQERRLIDSLQSLLIQCAQCLLKLTQKKSIREHLVRNYHPTRLITLGECEITGHGETVTITNHNQQAETFDELRFSLSQLERLANQTDLNLINPLDYFEPQQEFLKTEDDTYLQRGEMIVSMNPELNSIGNFVLNCFWHRVRPEFELLTKVRTHVFRAIDSAPFTYQKHREVLDDIWRNLVRLWDDCNKSFKTGDEPRLRESAIILTQTYAAFGIAPQLEWLGLPEEIIDTGGKLIKSRLNTFQNQQLTDRIAAALQCMEKLYDTDEFHADDTRAGNIKEAVSSGDLVLDIDSQTVYWENSKLMTFHGKVSWKFLKSLGQKARHGACVTEQDLYDEPVAESTMSTNCNRLKRQLPESLRCLIQSGQEPRSYILKLDRSKIHIFDLVSKQKNHKI